MTGTDATKTAPSDPQHRPAAPECADDQQSLRGRDDHSAQDPAGKVLTDAIYALLPPIHAVIAAHPNDGTRRCARCQVPQPCRGLDAAIDALELVMRTHHEHATRFPG